ncbi:5-hydroxytryptamine receptor 1D-like [Paramacrobiotus metropolitanus]|uniref:5-hydroxytryptamine receptor 1D-like n=1 Tax=Paramacrobiotus metropolitanus TaxID=2943436 RepID=UPI002445DB78|nr:5-hydroxytryptamine receptor 1D-like [Paramacrobiotus metropolitanus]
MNASLPNATIVAATNASASYDSNSGGSFVPTYLSLVIIHTIGLILNAILGWTFAIRANQKVPFDFYFLSLLAVNIVLEGTMIPFSYINAFYPVLNIGIPGCVFYVYAVYAFNIAQPVNHAVIALNRIWAMVHPISFRDFQKPRSVGTVIAIIWVVPHAIAMSTAVISVTSRHATQSMFCFNIMGVPSLAEKISESIQKIIGLLSFLITTASIPIVIWKLRKRLMGKENTVQPSTTNRSAASSQQTAHSMLSQPATSQSATNGLTPLKTNDGKDKEKAQENQANLFMGVLGVSIALCWAPYAIYFGFQPIFGYFNMTAISVVIILSSCQSVADPVLLFLTLPKWRKTVTDYFSSCR